MTIGAKLEPLFHAALHPHIALSIPLLKLHVEGVCIALFSHLFVLGNSPQKRVDSENLINRFGFLPVEFAD